MDLAGKDAGPEIGGVGGDGVDDQIGDGFAHIIPALAAGQGGGELLAEQAGDMGAGRGEAVIERRGDQHFHDRLARPAVRLRVAEGAVHIIEAGGDDDAGAVMDAGAGQHAELGQRRQRDIHAEGA